ncbi:hypothetical protein FNW52_08280 [Flavobacterium sp. ZT3R18]|uniref:hypothetical protein n=1 Tax=Flavobacterium sp. ZT3R18 TaxID=2594429 RepID=UPI00117BC904|nr:hypothetical protein [Flavobacterium sp. ZT3R18]TRX36594.1 hypothetical protein FNW52_08280 [Flavobacterium sp. ZT3R18]
MRKIRFLFPVLSILTLSVVSCTKEDIVAASDTTPVVASATIDVINELDIQTGTQVSFEKLTSKKTEKSLTSSCAIVTMDPQTTTFPKTFYVNFGDGCITNSITRKGKLKITFSGLITVAGSTMTVERVDYSVNGNKVEGKIVYKNTTASQNVPQWTRSITDGKFTNSKGEIYLNSGTHTVKQTAGVSTLSLDDNTYEMTEGTHTVTKGNGAKIILTILDPIVKNHSCDYVSKGKLKVESTLLNGVIDYGNGDCDNKATYTQNGIAFPITL